MDLILKETPIIPYKGEPHPDDEWEWKKWAVKKFFPHKEYLNANEIAWLDQYHKNTKAKWNVFC